MMKCKIINNKNFIDLVNLHIKLKKITHSNLTEYKNICNLIQLIENTQEFLAVGIYKNNSILGCIYGYQAQDHDTFHIEGLYCPNNPIALKKILNFFELHISSFGYKYFTACTKNKTVKKLIQKYNPTVNMYKGEL